VHTVVETPPYLRAVGAAGLSEAERTAIVTMLAADPEAGDVMPGTGGCRKVRVAGRGKGKSGGYRLITFFSGPALPVFLIDVFSKGERASLSKADANRIAKATALIVESYRRKG